MSDYPSPCDNCKQADACRNFYRCAAWNTRYRYKQKQINAYLKMKKDQYFATKFVYQHPDETRRLMQHKPCNGCEQEAECDIPCSAYLVWYDTRMAYARKVAEKQREQE
jgi:hypothetical protein